MLCKNSKLRNQIIKIIENHPNCKHIINDVIALLENDNSKDVSDFDIVDVDILNNVWTMYNPYTQETFLISLKQDDYKLGFIEKDSNRIVFNKNWNILLCTSQSRKWYGLREYPEHLLFKTSNCSN